MFITPLVRLPYSTDGIPLITSTLSMSSVLMVRISTPELAIPFTPVDAVAAAPFVYCMSASVFMGAPSTKKRVPKAFVM